MKKIFQINEITNHLKKIKKNKKIVLCHGVFDLVHYGHILHFQSAKKYGDYLVVSITKDKFIKKGPGKPLFNSETRMKFLSSLEIIDCVIESKSSSSIDILNLVKPNVYVKGPDYKKLKDDKSKKIILEKNTVEKYGGKIKFTKDQTYSSSSIINSTSLLFDEEQRKFLNQIKEKFGVDYILKKINDFKKIEVLVLGELIFDNYIYGDVIGKAGKEPHLVIGTKKNEYYVGGGGAIVRHLQTFVKKVNYVSNFGGEKILSKLINSSFLKNVYFKNVRPYKKFNSIIKSRYVDMSSGYKMFGAYKLPEKPDGNYNELFHKDVKKIIHQNMLVVVADYGHQLLPTNLIMNSLQKARCTSVNSQINSSSIGSHNISKYKQANILIINEAELRFEEKNQTSNIEIILKNFSKKLRIKNIILTRGKNGSIYFKSNKFYYCPAFAVKSVDKVGAGDAMLSLCSLAKYINLEPELILLIGSLAASVSVQTSGNKDSVNYFELTNLIEYILK